MILNEYCPLILDQFYKLCVGIHTANSKYSVLETHVKSYLRLLPKTTFDLTRIQISVQVYETLKCKSTCPMESVAS